MFIYKNKDFKSKADLRDWLDKQPLLLRNCRFILCNESITCKDAGTCHVSHVKNELMRRIMIKSERFIYENIEYKTREDLILHLKKEAIIRNGVLYVGQSRCDLTADYSINISLLIEELASKIVGRSCYLL